MMAEWSASFVQPCCFNTDGIVDYERWAALPDGKHIVVLLKETNALSGGLVDFLSHGGSKTYYRTWNNVARWANMILNGTYWKFVPKSALDDMVRNIAVINLKKCSGSAHASAKAVRQAARQDANRLKRQIQLYEPDIILTGGWGLVSNILHDEILADDAEWVKPNGQTALDSVMVLYELFSPFGKRNARCEYAASKSSGEVLDIRARKDSARDRTIIKTARNI